MINLLLDTNIVLLILRAKNYTGVIDFINPMKVSTYVSVVTEAEIRSIAKQNNWSVKKTMRLEEFLDELTIVEMYQSNVSIYVEIDAYSQRRNPLFPDYPFATPRNMGKNDLWIASLAALLDLQLVTTDADFDHLNGVFFDTRRISVQEFQRFF